MDQCSTCQIYKQTINKLANFFHAEGNKDYNIKVMEVNCSQQNVVQLCQYFGVSKLPRFGFLSQETSKLHLHPVANWRGYEVFRDFAIQDYKESLTALPL